jgi:hypothetical protein
LTPGTAHSNEFTIEMENRPGTLGKFSEALAERAVNIVAFQAGVVERKKSLARIVVDNYSSAKTVLDNQRVTYTETQVATVTLPQSAR